MPADPKSGNGEEAERTCCVWCPAWPVATARHDDPSLNGVELAVVERGTRGLVVRAASAEARTEGVKIGLRKREAEARCAGLVVLDADPVAEARAFEILARAIEPVTPAVVLERPGVLSFPTRGPSRYFGGDDGLCARVLEVIRAIGTVETRVGIADGAFAARLAARTAGASASAVIPPGDSGPFLAPWSVSVLAGVVDDGEALALLLERLGLPTLGDLAGLAEASVLARFGVDGARAHRLARGLAEHTAPPVPPPPDLAETCELDPPAERVDEVAFAFKALADQLLSRLDALGLSCTHVVVEAETEHGEHLARCWRHEGVLTPAALVARIRWQLDGWLTATGGLSGGLTLVRLAPERVVPATSRQLGFWGGDAAAHDRADRALARLQGMLGEDAVVTAVVCGGRAPSERVRWVPWGEPRESGLPKGAEQPAWPGAVPGPAPARVHAPPVPAELLDGAGDPVTVSSRGEASAPPSLLRSAVLPGGGGAIAAWAGPWAHDLRWWDRVTRRRRALWQIVVRPDGSADDSDGSADVACLVVLESGRAAIEAVYD